MSSADSRGNSAAAEIYAIADVHGRADLLGALLKHIESDTADRNVKPVILFLGDLIDRGPHSPQVLDLVAETIERFPGSQLILGNHDFYLRALLRDELKADDAVNWMDWGGVATITSYSDRPVPDFKRIAADIRAAFPHHLVLLNGALTYKEIGSFCFVHAGIRPGISLTEQDPYDLRWIRSGFLDHHGALSHIVVHGHTITASLRPEVHPYRIALDTGAYRSGRLSAVVIRQDTLSHFLCTDLTAAGDVLVDEWRPA